MPLFLSLLACSLNAPRSDADGDAFVVRTYAVPAGYETQVEGTLTRVFWRGDDQPLGGRAYPGPPGTLVVAAPASAHAGVEEVVAAFATLDARDAVPRNVRVEYWVVAGRHSAAVDTKALPAAVATALEPVAAAEAPMTYTVLLSETLMSLDGDHAEANGDGFFVSQTVSVGAGGHVVADLRIEVPGGLASTTRVQLAPGQVLVLGETAPAAGAESDALFYVVRPELVPAG